MSDILPDVLGPQQPVAYLSGPSFAAEIVRARVATQRSGAPMESVTLCEWCLRIFLLLRMVLGGVFVSMSGALGGFKPWQRASRGHVEACAQHESCETPTVNKRLLKAGEPRVAYGHRTHLIHTF